MYSQEWVHHAVQKEIFVVESIPTVIGPSGHTGNRLVLGGEPATTDLEPSVASYEEYYWRVTQGGDRVP